MKRLIPVLILLISILFLFACEKTADEKEIESTPVASSVPTRASIPAPTTFASSAPTTESPAPTPAEEEPVFITSVPTKTPPTPAPVPTPAPTPAPTPTPEPTPEPTPTATPEPEGLIGWTEGGFVSASEQTATETEYVSENLHFTVTTVHDKTTFGKRVTYYVTDVYMRNIGCLRTSAADSFRSSSRDKVASMAKRAGALLAISGDMFNAHKHSVVIRNGEVFDTKPYSNWEVCFLYLDGTMEMMTADEYKNSTPRDDVWQAWQFGPSLLDRDGHAIESFPQSKVNPQNPRCAIGYFEPGHYCFVTVDGRQKQSRGLELFELASLMESLGCKAAFNLDGGESASLYWNGGIYSKPCNGGRSMSDIIYLIDVGE